MNLPALYILTSAALSLALGVFVGFRAGRPPHRFHGLATRWLPTVQGYRTIAFLFLMGLPVTWATSYRIYEGTVESPHLAGIIAAVGGLIFGSVASYAYSKRTSGQRALDMARADAYGDAPSPDGLYDSEDL